MLAIVPGTEEDDRVERRVLTSLWELSQRPPLEPAAPDAEIALSWLADHGAAASVLDAEGEPEEVARLVLSVARDPDLTDGRIVPR